MPALVNLRNVSLTHGSKEILSDINWSIVRGEHALLFGPNGSGKTCLLKIITGYEWPNLGGVVEVFGERYGATHIPTLRQCIGWVSSSLAAQIYPALTSREAVVVGIDAAMDTYRVYTDGELARADHALSRLNATHLSERLYMQLSQGERQRILVARAIVSNPGLLILDEPCAGLDPGAREDFLDDLSMLAAGASAPTILLVSHHLEEIRPFIRSAFMLKDGACVAKGPIERTLTSEVLTRLYDRPCMVTQRNGCFQLSIGPLAVR
ncbi:ATP-binding cassette domain-containing protein [Candidatus Sumerlaeota bacterium]|nr:ATP-binding cassette domain-containing protein [Candidatus Sumerlaeota bacterium]